MFFHSQPRTLMLLLLHLMQLGVKPDANQKEIDRAYQKLIGKFDSSEGKKESVDKPTLKEKNRNGK